MAQPKFEDQAVAATFAGYPAPVRARLLALRAIIYEVARETPGVGPLEETLKWGQPAYLTAKTRSGVTIRIAPHNPQGSNFAIYVSCNSGVVEDWRARYPTLEYGGNRSIRFNLEQDLDTPDIRHCIALALTWHQRKKPPKTGRSTTV